MPYDAGWLCGVAPERRAQGIIRHKMRQGKSGLLSKLDIGWVSEPTHPTKR